MKKKTLSLALALVMCLGLTIPALAAEPYTFSAEYSIGLGSEEVGMVVDITNVLDYYSGDYGYDFDCAAPVKIEPKYYQDKENSVFEMKVEKLPDDAEPDLDDIYSDSWVQGEWIIPEPSESVTLTEPGLYHVEIYMVMPGSGDYLPYGGYGHYVIEIQADSSSGGATSPADTIPASGTAYASTQTVTVDGRAVEFQMYALKDENGNGTNYIKLRDLAYVLNGTQAQFEVGYDGTISLTTGQSYTAAGGEMTTPFSGDRSYTGGTQTVKIDGGDAAMTAITLLDDNGGGYNYFKLRDLGRALGFNVSWSAEQGVSIETDKPYAE